MRRFGMALALTLALAGAAAAQGLRLAGDQPIAIDAATSLAWDQDARTYVATGDVVITQGDTVLTADRVTAHYRERDGATQIYRIEADGNVRLANPTQTVTGARGVYDLDEGVAVFTGGTPTLSTPNQTVTARDELRYLERERRALAIGDAVALRDGNRLDADRLLAVFTEGGDGQLQIERIEGEGGVVITTATDIARGDRGVYEVGRERAELQGNVKLTRGANQLNGAVAEVNMRTGESRILAGDTGRVRGLIVPGQGLTTAPQGGGN